MRSRQKPAPPAGADLARTERSTPHPSAASSGRSKRSEEGRPRPIGPGVHRTAQPGAGGPGLPSPALVEIRVRGGPVPHWMQDLQRRWGAGIRLHVCRQAGGPPRRLLQLLEINALPETLPEVMGFLRQRTPGHEITITQLGSHRLLVRLVGPLPALCHSVFEMGAICMSCPFLPAPSPTEEGGDEGEWRVLVHRVRDAHPLLASFTTPGDAPASLVRVGPYRGTRDLTPRQEMAVGTAFALGYYDFPRRAQLKDVARSLGVSRATVMESLRRGMRKLASQRQAEVGALRPIATAGEAPGRSRNRRAEPAAPSAGPLKER